jgi:hypothetical protein
MGVVGLVVGWWARSCRAEGVRVAGLRCEIVSRAHGRETRGRRGRNNSPFPAFF